jgi:hypothetical protein
MGRQTDGQITDRQTKGYINKHMTIQIGEQRYRKIDGEREKERERERERDKQMDCRIDKDRQMDRHI